MRPSLVPLFHALIPSCSARERLGLIVVLMVAMASGAAAAPEFVQRAQVDGTGPAAVKARPVAKGWFTRALEAASTAPITECEYFLLAPESGEGGEATGPTGGGLALIAQRRVARPGEVLLEREVLFEEGSLRVLHTERIKGERRTLTYREIQPAGARTWQAEWNAEGGRGRILGHGWHRPTHEIFVAPAELKGPLELLDDLRSGVPATSVSMLDPLAARASQLEVEWLPGSETASRVLRATRSDGTLALEVGISEGVTELGFLRFTRGQRVASAIKREEYERRFELWNRPRIPAHERVRATLLGQR